MKDNFKKNDLVTLEITDLGSSGEGIGKVDGFTLFVKDALIGDVIQAKIIKLKKNYGYGRLMEIVTPSPARVEARCLKARACGGCQIQPLDYEKQLEYKENKVGGLLERVGKIRDYVMEPIIGMEEPWHYRNKAQFPVGKDKDGKIITGFYAGRTHSIVPLDKCFIQHPLNEQIMSIVQRWMEEFNISSYDEVSHKGLVRHIFTRIGKYTEEVMVCLVINGKKIPKEAELIERLKQIPGIKSICLNVNRENTNVILGKDIQCLWGQPYITDKIGEISYRISPLSFFQVNPIQTQKLYATALEYAGLTGKETVWDLYCGIGTISLFLAQAAKKVYGVEIVPEAIRDAQENARLNHIENAEFFVGKAEEVLPEQYEKNGVYADVIVVDPPRKGCDEKLLACMVQMAPETIVYVSCDPATLARDLNYLSNHGYKVKKVRCTDMFPHSVHVETVVLLSRETNPLTVEVRMEVETGEVKEHPTYKRIQEYVQEKYGFKVHTAYIAEVKRMVGLDMHKAPNAVEQRKHEYHPCPPEKVEAIKDALRHFGLIAE